MRSVRQGVFETNSSSCHCLVICSLTEWNRFTNGDLFARCSYYKGENVDRLVNMDEVYALLQEDITKYWAEPRPTLELVRWIYSGFSTGMLKPESGPLFDDLSFRDSDDSWWAENAPDELKEFISEHPGTLGDLLDWVALIETPYSYEMLRVLSYNFTREVDEYESVAPYEETDPKKMNQWGVNYLLGPDYPEPPAMKCRAIWYY